MMIDARPDDDDDDERDQTTKWSLTNKEVVSLSAGFLLAGYDTTANTLGYAAYLLAINPDKQDTLIQEIDAYLEQNKVRWFSQRFTCIHVVCEPFYSCIENKCTFVVYTIFKIKPVKGDVPTGLVLQYFEWHKLAQLVHGFSFTVQK